MNASPEMNLTDRGCDGEPSGGDGRLLVASRLTLLSQAVEQALRSRDLPAQAIALPVDIPTWSADLVQAGDVVIYLDDMTQPGDLRLARDRIEASPARSIVLTLAPHGMTWAALIASGADLVAPADITLDELTRQVREVMAGHDVLGPEARGQMLAAWAEALERIDALNERIGRLSPREREILERSADGQAVIEIAVALGLAPGTIRSHGKGIRNKLAVHSQLAAVALLRELTELERGAQPHSHHPEPGHGVVQRGPAAQSRELAWAARSDHVVAYQ